MVADNSKPMGQAPGHGEGPSTQVGSLDLGNERDRGLLRQSIKRRWPGLDDDKKAKAITALDAALDAAQAAKDYDAVNGIVRTLAMIESQHQADDHLADKNARLDGGKFTAVVKLYAAASDTDAV